MSCHHESLGLYPEAKLTATAAVLMDCLENKYHVFFKLYTSPIVSFDCVLTDEKSLNDQLPTNLH